MPIEKPARRLVPLKAGGIWDESTTPARVGGTGLAACTNLVYRRYGSWSKRSGSTPAYRGATSSINNSLISGFRWYRAFPTPLTQVIVATQTQLLIGTTPAPGISPFSPMTPIATFFQNTSAPPCFTSMRDPVESGVPLNPASDVLIICGASLPAASYARGYLTFSGVPAAGQNVYVYFTGVAPSTTYFVVYTVLASDTLGSIATAVSGLINQTGAVTPSSISTVYPIFLAPTTAVVSNFAFNVSIPIHASAGGAAGNGITFYAQVGGPTGLVVTPATAQQLLFGGNPLVAPLKYDGTYVTGLSANIQQNFAGCVSWHNHLWFWGDPANPDSVYASDIDNPEGFSFMTTYGSYDIGVGDGDPMVQACIPIGNNLYVFKRDSIYVITGYDFQSGEYQFSVQPVAKGFGIPYRQCAAHLRNAIVFWSGTGFYRLANGAFDPEYIGGPIPYTSQKIAVGAQDLMRCAAGSYTIQTAYGPELRTNIAMWACDVAPFGLHIADHVLVYDDDASSSNISSGTNIASYAWSLWTGWQVATFIPFSGGAGPNTTLYDIGDIPALYYIPQLQNTYFTINQVGGNATNDVFTTEPTGTNLQTLGISFSATTGWIDFETPVLAKQMHQIFLDVEVAVGAKAATFSIIITSRVTSGYVLIPTMVTATMENYQDLKVRVNPSLRGKSYQCLIQEDGTGTGYEIVGITYDFVEEALVT